MTTESQMDGWRKDIGANLRKAGDAFLERGEEMSGPGEMMPADRAHFALNAAMITSNIMIAERLGQIVQGLFHQDEALAAATDRVRTGEQIITRFTQMIEEDEIPLSEEATVMVTMAEDWLDSEGIVKFSTPEQIEEELRLAASESEHPQGEEIDES